MCVRDRERRAGEIGVPGGGNLHTVKLLVNA